MIFKVAKEKKGITLIALVITIIVLLILTGVTINLTLGENGIFRQATRAKEEYEQAQKEEENILSGYEDKINEYAGIDWNTVLANAEKHPNQKTSTAIGVGTNGRAVNMDLWEYTKLDNGTYGLNTEEAFNNKEVGGDNETDISTIGYKGNFIDGKIEGTIPQYISIDNGNSFQEVSSLYLTFNGCLDLIQAPNIPDTVTNMMGTFVGDTNLEIVSKIPNNVIDMTSTFYECSNLQEIGNISNNVTEMAYAFYKCSSLKEVPNIPDSVTNMQGTFQGCTSLTLIPNISNSVINMNSTFKQCTSLATVPMMPDSVINMQGAFQGCTSLTSIPNISSGVTNMQDTFKDCTSLTSVPTIPTDVINMIGTFFNCVKLQGELVINANLSGKIIDDTRK